MRQKTVYQYDLAGRYVGPAVADESPLEAGVYHLPARTVEAAPPEAFPDGTWPRWNGAAWELSGAAAPARAIEESAVAKLAAFLAANPDVAELVK